MTETWKDELRGLLDSVPGGAGRLIRAIDTKRMNPYVFQGTGECGTVGCVYGHVYGDASRAYFKAMDERDRQHGDTGEFTAVEDELDLNGSEAIRAEVVCWLAEHGTALNPHGAPAGETAGSQR